MSKDKRDTQTVDMFEDDFIKASIEVYKHYSNNPLNNAIANDLYNLTAYGSIDTQAEAFDGELFISQLRDDHTTHIPKHIKTQEQFLEWINGVFVPEEEYDENGMVIRGYN